MFEIERVRDREKKIGYSLHKGTETLVRDRERFEIEGVRDRESQLYYHTSILLPKIVSCMKLGTQLNLKNPPINQCGRKGSFKKCVIQKYRKF